LKSRTKDEEDENRARTFCTAAGDMSGTFDETETRWKISQARKVHGRPYSDPIPRGTSFGDVFKAQAAQRGDQIYLIYRDGDARHEFSYADFYARCSRVGNFMRRELGIKPGDRVATFSYNHFETVTISFAAWMIGACLVPISVGEADDRVRFIQENAEAKAVFVMPDLIERYEKLWNGENPVPHRVQIGGVPKPGFCHLQEADRQPSTLDVDNLATLTTEALIVYTSGTTGMPKGVVLEQQQLLADAHSIAEWYGLKPSDRMQLVLPIHHVNGLIVTLVTPVYFGGSVILNRKFSASRYWEIAEREGATCASAVPTILAFLCEHGEDISKRNLSRFSFVICGAGPLTIELGKRFEEQFRIPIIHGYGLSETTAYSCFLPFDLSPEEHRRWMRDYGYPSIGVAISCNEMAIHDLNGGELPAEQKGEIVIRGQNVMKHYLKRPEANAETFRFGWFRSGDEGFFKMDEKGQKFYFITGRIKELIIRGGINYSPLEIDEVINRVPGVKAGMAVGFENDFYGEEVGAYVVRAPGDDLTSEQFLAACAAKLPWERRPKVVVFGEEFPVTSTGKYQRNKLKPLFAQWRGTSFSR